MLELIRIISRIFYIDENFANSLIQQISNELNHEDFLFNFFIQCDEVIKNVQFLDFFK